MKEILDTILHFDRFTLDLKRGCLRSEDQDVSMRPKTFEVLCHLANNPGRLVPKEELAKTVWPKVAVSDDSLVQCIRELRKKLGDTEHLMIKTISRRGYLFDVAIEVVNPASIETASASAPNAPLPVASSVNEDSSSTDRKTSSVHSPGQHFPLNAFPSGGGVAPDKDSAAELRPLTILACDAIGAAALAEHLEPEDLRDVITECNKYIADVVEHFDGKFSTHSVDGLFVYFGYPQTHEDDAECAVRCALALGSELAKLKFERLEAPLQPRISISTGLVLVDEFAGPDAATGFRVVGEASHLAALLLTVADPGSVVISASTRNLIGDLFELEAVGKEATGKLTPNVPGQSIKAFRVVRESAGLSRFDALRSSGTRLIGRDEELSLLARRWREAKSGKGCVVSLTGEPGIGKSKLTRTLQDKLVAEAFTPVLCYCSPYFQDKALHPIVSQLLLAADIATNDDASTKLDKFETFISRSDTIPAEDIALFAALLSIPGTTRYPLPQLTSRRLKECTLDALLGLLKRLAARMPVMIIFEDLQWIDATSLELLSHVVEAAHELPLLLLATFRPEFAPPWPNHRHVTTISLSRLNQSESADLIAGVSRARIIPDNVVERIVGHADGVPLFVEELTKAVLEGGGRDTGHEYGSSASQPRHAVPATLHASLLARLDHVASVKETAQIGAVIGREFSYSLIAALSPLPEQDLRAALSRLTEAELVFQRGTPPDATYIFKHALVQDAIYASLLRERRRRLHDKVAGAIEKSYPEIVAAQPEVLAHHCTEAGLTLGAIGYWLKAGELASALSANEEAFSHLKRGLALVREIPRGAKRDEQEFRIQCALGPVLNATQGYAADATLAAFERARELISTTGDLSNLDFVMEGLTTAYFNLAAYEKCLNVRLEFLEIAKREKDPLRLCTAYRGLASVNNVFGDFRSARRYAARTWILYDRAKHGPLARRYVRDIGVSALCHRSIAEWHLGDSHQSALHLNDSLALAESTNHPNTVGYAHCWAAVLSFIARDYGALTSYATSLKNFGLEQSLPQYAAWGTCLVAAHLAADGQHDKALEMVRSGLALREQIQARALSPVFLCILADIHHRVGNKNAALSTIDEALMIAQDTKECWMDADLWRLKGGVIAASSTKNLPNKAESSYRRALDIAQEQGSRMFALRIATEFSRSLAGFGRSDQARDVLAPIAATFTEGVESKDLAEAKALLGQLA